MNDRCINMMLNKLIFELCVVHFVRVNQFRFSSQRKILTNTKLFWKKKMSTLLRILKSPNKYDSL